MEQGTYWKDKIRYRVIERDVEEKYAFLYEEEFETPREAQEFIKGLENYGVEYYEFIVAERYIEK